MQINIRNVLYISTVSIVAIVFMGCGGGGPSTSTPDTNGTTPPVIDTNTTDTNGTTPPSGPIAGVDYTDSSQFMQTKSGYLPNNQAMSGVDVAHDNGFTGGNLSQTTSYTTVASDSSNRNLQTVIAVLDSGINGSHEDLNSTNKIVAWKDFTATNSSTPYDNMGHGSMVSEIAAGNRQSADDAYYGIAYGAQLIAGQIMHDSGNTDNFTLTDGINWVSAQADTLNIDGQRKVSALNLSLGTTDATFVNANFLTALNGILSRDISVVVAAGNEGLSCLPDANGNISGRCSFPAAAPWLASGNSLFAQDGGWIVVGSVGANENISSFSNKAGVTKDHYLVALGEWVTGAAYDQNDGYKVGSGTSFATPLVAGAMALMDQKWPYLTGKQHAQILFDTAKDLGAVGIDDVYGNGLLDLRTAFNPVGTVAIPTGVNNVNAATNVHTISIANTRLTTSGAMARLSSFAPISNTIMVDGYNRDFNAGLTSVVSSDGSSPINFDNFVAFHFGKVLFGVDQQKSLPMIGYNMSGDLSVRMSVDDKTLLGMQTDGAFKIGTGYTVYTNVKYSLLNGEDFKASIEGIYAYGKASSIEDSLITDITPVHAVGGKFKASYDGFGAGFEVPLRTVNGSMTFNTPTGIDSNGNVITTKASANLAPNTFEHNYSLFYEAAARNISALAQLRHTEDAYGITHFANNEARVFLNYWY